MGVTSHDAPQWYVSSFLRSARGAGATAPEDVIRGVGQKLLDRWSTPARRFHNLRHLADVLRRVDELCEEAHHPDLVRLAAWYHGAIFDAGCAAASAGRGGEDQSASARLALQELGELGVPQPRAQRVAEIVSALAHHVPEVADIDCAVLCDADLAVLAAEPQRYREYLTEMRQEHSHIPPADYVAARIATLSSLMARNKLFLSPLGEQWEEPARQNIDAELQRLRKELEKLAASA